MASLLLNFLDQHAVLNFLEEVPSHELADSYGKYQPEVESHGNQHLTVVHQAENEVKQGANDFLSDLQATLRLLIFRELLVPHHECQSFSYECHRKDKEQGTEELTAVLHIKFFKENFSRVDSETERHLHIVNHITSAHIIHVHVHCFIFEFILIIINKQWL